MKLKVIYRQATNEDVLLISDLEKKVWGQNAASVENLKSRIKTFPNGNIVAVLGGRMVGYVSGVIISTEFADKCKTWYDYTDSGNARKCFDPNGNLLFGTSLTVDNSIRNSGIGSTLLIHIARMCIENNLRAGILGGRIPNYYKKKNMKVMDYLKLKNESGKIYDPELRLYLRMGLKIVKIQKNYFKDPESLDYGVILEWKNPFYSVTRRLPFLAKPLSMLFRL
jgi:ribosomal protein S18 acetylase RimI-like enzyme